MRNCLRKILGRPLKKTWSVKITGSEAIKCSKCGLVLEQNILKPVPVCENCGTCNWLAIGSDY